METGTGGAGNVGISSRRVPWAAFSVPRIPAPPSFWPLFHLLIGNSLVPPRHRGHLLLFIPASCLILPEFCSPSSILAWQPLTFQLPGNLMTTRPGLVPHTGKREGRRPALVISLELSCRVQSLGTGIPPVGPVATLPPSSPEPCPPAGQGIVLEAGCPLMSPHLTCYISKPLRTLWGQLGTLSIRGRCSLFSRVLIRLEH